LRCEAQTTRIHFNGRFAAAWKLAPALAAGNAVIIKPAEQTPMSLLVLAELVQDILPAGVLNIVDAFGLEAGKPLASPREQFRRWAHTRWTVDVVPGRGASFSLEAPLDMRFLIRSSRCPAQR
jgi:hypothetical protein